MKLPNANPEDIRIWVPKHNHYEVLLKYMNDCLDCFSPTGIALRLGDKLKENFSEACLLMVCAVKYLQFNFILYYVIASCSN